MSLQKVPKPLQREIRELELKVTVCHLSDLTLAPTILEHIRVGQEKDPFLFKIKEAVSTGKRSNFSFSDEGILIFKGRICVPKDWELRRQILSEAHDTPYYIHLGATKMYIDLKENFWWHRMKKNIARYVEKCLTCQQVKAKHQKSAGELQPI